MKQREKILKTARYATFFVWGIALLMIVLHRGTLTADAISSHLPQQPVPAALAVLLLYACKTVSMVFPLKLLQLAAGALFPRRLAVLVNLGGTAVSAAVGYRIGRFIGRDAAAKYVNENPRLAALLAEQNSNTLRFSFFLRSLVFLPLDAVSLYFGAVQAPFYQYLLGSLLGMLPNVLISTCMGASLTEPGSPAFLLSCGSFALLTLISFVWYLLDRRKRR